MRTDATIDSRQVICSNASLLAYGHAVARVGDWITYAYPDGGPVETGRMLGRVAYAPATGDKARNTYSPEIRNWIIVLTINHDLTHAYERWVNPAWVTTVRRPAPDIARFLAWYAGPLPPREETRFLAEYGSLHANQQPDQTSWDCAEGIRRGHLAYVRVREGRKHLAECRQRSDGTWTCGHTGDEQNCACHFCTALRAEMKGGRPTYDDTAAAAADSKKG